MNSFKPSPEASKYLNKNQKEILEEWTSDLRRSGHIEKDTDEIALLNSMPIFLQNISNWIASGDIPHKQILAENISSTHGDQRASMKDYDIDQVISEYHSLKRSMIRKLKEKKLLSGEIHSFLNYVFDVAVHDAARAFSGARSKVRIDFAHSDFIIDPGFLKKAETTTMIMSILVIVFGFMNLTEWLLGIEFLFRVKSYAALMRPTTSVCFILTGFAFLFSYGHTLKQYLVTLSQVFMGLVSLISLLTLTSHFGLHNIYLDQLLTGGKEQAPVVVAVGFFVLSIVAVLLKVKRPGAVSLGQLMAGLIIAMGYGYCYAYFIDAFEVGISLGTELSFASALGFLFIGIAAFLSRASSAVSLLLVSPHAGGQLIRWIIPIFFCTPFLMGGVYFFLKNNEIVNTVMAFSFILIAILFFLFSSVWILALKLDRSELDRENSLHQVEKAVSSRETTLHSYYQLEEVTEAKEQFVSALTHDIRSPLSACKLLAEMALSRGIEDDKTKDCIKRIIGNVEKTDRMINSLLDAKKITAGEKLPLNREPTDLSELLKIQVIEFNLERASSVESEIEENIKGSFDQEKITRLAENLLSNALKYGDGGRPVILSLRKRDKRIVLSAHNWGHPIPPEEQEQIFESYYRSKSAKKTNVEGWGLGLAFVKNVAQAHGGGVDLTSSEESGTCFSVHFPV